MSNPALAENNFMSSLLRSLLSTVLLLLCSWGALGVAFAEVRFGPFAWVAGEGTPGRSTLLVIVPKGQPAPGFFVGALDGDTEIGPSELSPNLFFEKKKGVSFFLGFHQNSFRSLVLSTGKQFPIWGGITIASGNVRIAVGGPDSLHLDQGYSTIVENDQDIRGFIGLTPIFHFKGKQYVDLLEANQDNQLSRFEVSKSGLMLGGKPFRGERLGLALEIKNKCLDLPIVDSNGNPVAREDGWLVYRVLTTEFFVFNLLNETFGVVKELPSGACVYSPIDLSGATPVAAP